MIDLFTPLQYTKYVVPHFSKIIELKIKQYIQVFWQYSSQTIFMLLLAITGNKKKFSKIKDTIAKGNFSTICVLTNHLLALIKNKMFIFKINDIYKI